MNEIQIRSRYEEEVARILTERGIKFKQNPTIVFDKIKVVQKIREF